MFQQKFSFLRRKIISQVGKEEPMSLMNRRIPKISKSVFSPNAGKYGPEIDPYLDTFQVVHI